MTAFCIGNSPVMLFILTPRDRRSIRLAMMFIARCSRLTDDPEGQRILTSAWLYLQDTYNMKLRAKKPAA